jgi:hypothetical protein
VDVQVHDGLAGGFPCIEPDVVAVRLLRQTRIQVHLGRVNQLKNRRLLLRFRVEPRCNQPPSDYKQVARTDWKAVPDSKRVRIADKPL